MSLLSDFFEKLRGYSIELSKEQLDKLKYYFHLIKKFNNVIHLTSKRDTEFSIVKNFYDSAILTVFLPHYETLLDMGAGAGFVGIITKIIRPESKVYLVERSVKKTSFLSIVVKELDLKDTFVLQSDWSFLGVKGEVAVSKASCGLVELVKLMPNYLIENGLLVHFSSSCKRCVSADKFYRYFSPYTRSASCLCVFVNKADKVPRGTFL